LNLLGSGAYGVKPGVAVSYVFKRLSPHINVGYQWNGQSLLAGDLKTKKADLPDQILYSSGFDYGVSDKLTLAFDFLGQHVIDSPRLGQSTFIGADGNSYPDFQSRFGSFNVNSGSVGFKTNLAKRVLVNFNLRFRLNHAGLHEKVSPLVGIEYSF
jgi:hypothetical protein